MKTMKQVAEQLAISSETIRYYEQIGLITVARDHRGYRQFDQQVIDWLFLIKMLRKSGMTIERLLTYVQLVQQGDQTIAARKALLEEQEHQLQKQLRLQKTTLDMLSQKIASYDNQLLAFERERLEKGE